MKIEIENSKVTMRPTSIDSHELTACDCSLGVYQGSVVPRIGENVVIRNDNTTYTITNVTTYFGDTGESPSHIKLTVKPID